MPLQPDVGKHLLRLRNQQELDKQTSKGDYDYICKKKDGMPLRPDCVTISFRYYLKKYNLPYIGFHDLRHSATSLLQAMGFSPKEIAEWLGHGDLRSINIYTHVEDAAKEHMADRLGEVIQI